MAPAEGAIEATLQFGDGQFPSSLDRADDSTVTSSGLRPATPEEIAADFPSGGTPDAGGPSIDDDDEPSEPPAPLDADPT
ncbi:MAG: hypothetical protein KF782_28000 [Labilithrix sp.]|nr:hypothetical protein [Labilithrix sp.]